MSTWDNPAIDTRMRELYALPECSSQEIANRLNGEFGIYVSRNAVIGRANRIGLPPRKISSANKKPRKPRERKPTKYGGMTSLRFGEPLVTFAPRIIPDAPPSLNLTIVELRADSCRFIAGDDHLFCGHAAQKGSSYCPAHHALCTQPRSRKAEAA